MTHRSEPISDAAPALVVVGRARAAAWLVLMWAAGLAPAPAEAQSMAEVAERVRRHDDAGALAALSQLPRTEQARAGARYLRGRLLERLGRLSEASAAYPLGADAASLPGPVRDSARRRAATALARTGRCAAARPLLDGDVSALAEARRAECALALGETREAIPLLRAVAAREHASVDLFAVRFALAEALAREGDRQGAIAELEGLWVERPEHPEAARAEAALVALRGAPLALSFDRRMDRLERLARERRFREALAELDALGRPTEAAHLRRYLHTRGMTLYRARGRYADAAEVLTESARQRGAHAEEDAFHAARARSRAGNDVEAVRAFRAFAAAHPRHAQASEALFLAAWLELRSGTRGAEARMDRFLRSPAARRGDFARDATWELALAAFEARRHARAEALFARYAELGPEAMVRARGRYWTGRAREARGDRAGAIEAYTSALHVEALHWYALLARQRLDALGAPVPPPFAEGPEAGTSAPPTFELPEDVAFYAELGLDADAAEALAAQEDVLRRQGPRALVEAYRRLDRPSRLLRLHGGASTLRRAQAPGPSDRWRWDAAFPRPWEERVEAAAAPVGLRAAHLYAVMRQESGFDPDVVSYADAIGLMQLLPTTAVRVGEGLGATYVGGLARRFGIPLAFAAFNAGGHRVEEWLRARGRTELDLFVEHIPFEQTRNYVRRVTTHLAHYMYLEDPARGWPLSLPTHVESAAAPPARP